MRLGALCNAVTLVAGDIGGLMVPVPAGYLGPSHDEAEIERVGTAALAMLPRDDGVFLAWLRTVPSSGE